MSSPTAPDVREWLDRLAIEAIIHQYADAVTRADWAAVFTLVDVDAGGSPAT